MEKFNNLAVETTQKCNLSCQYCYLGKRDHKLIDMSIDIADEIIFFLNSKLTKNQYFNISFWGGEPLLNFPIIKHIISKCHLIETKLNIKFSFNIITNGTFMNNEMLNFIFENKVYLQISLDGNENNHDCNRMTKKRKGSHAKVMKTISKVRKAEELTGVKLLHVKGTFTKSSLPLKNMIDFYDKYELPFVLTPATSSPNINESNRITPFEVEEQTKQMCKAWFLQFMEDSYSKNGIIKETLETILFKKIKLHPCSAGINSFSIGANGIIYACHRSFEDKVSTIGDLWKGINFTNLTLKYYNMRNNEKKHCYTCAFLSLCPGICPAESAIAMNKQYVDHVYCIYYKTLFKECLIRLLYLKNNDNYKYNLLINKLIANYNEKNKTSIMNSDFKQIKLVKNTTLIHSDLFFKQKTNVYSFDLDNDGILYHKKSNKRYIANMTTMAIWDLLDNRHTALEIAQIIASVCEVKLKDIEEDIYQQLATLQKLGFIEEVKEETYA